MHVVRGRRRPRPGRDRRGRPASAPMPILADRPGTEREVTPKTTSRARHTTKKSAAVSATLVSMTANCTAAFVPLPSAS